MKHSDLIEVVKLTKYLDEVMDRLEGLTEGEEIYLSFSGDKDASETIFQEDCPDLYAKIISHFETKRDGLKNSLTELGVKIEPDTPGGQLPLETPKVGRVG